MLSVWKVWGLLLVHLEEDRLLAQLCAHAIGVGGLGFDSQAGQISMMSPTARHHCYVKFLQELCCPGPS